MLCKLYSDVYKTAIVELFRRPVGGTGVDPSPVVKNGNLKGVGLYNYGNFIYKTDSNL